MPVIVDKLAGLPDAIKDRYRRNLHVAGAFYKAEVEKLVHKFEGAGVHSRPGEPPNWQTGRLANSFYVEVHDLTMRVRSSAPYAKYLERGAGRLAPRPYAAPAWRNNAATIRRLILKGS